MSHWYANSTDVFTNDINHWANDPQVGDHAVDITAAVKAYIEGQQTLASDRVYHNTLKWGVLTPAVMMEWDFGGSEETLGTAAGIGRATVEIFAYGPDPTNAYNLAEDIRTGLPEVGNPKPFHRFRGDLEGIFVLDTISPNGYERGSVPPQKGRPDGLWWVSREYSFVYRELVLAAP